MSKAAGLRRHQSAVRPKPAAPDRPATRRKPCCQIRTRPRKGNGFGESRRRPYETGRYCRVRIPHLHDGVLPPDNRPAPGIEPAVRRRPVVRATDSRLRTRQTRGSFTVHAATAIHQGRAPEVPRWTVREPLCRCGTRGLAPVARGRSHRQYRPCSHRVSATKRQRGPWA